MILAKTIKLFLESIGRSEEVDFYLRKFQAHETPFFALVIPDADTLAQGGEVLGFHLEFLVTLGLAPLLVVPAEADIPAMSGHPVRVHRDPAAATPGDGIPVLVTDAPPDELVPELARRVHFLRPRGGLRTTTGEPIMVQYTNRTNPHTLQPEDETACARAADLAISHPGTHVSITSPLDLLREMFTVRGAGTILRRGSVIEYYATRDRVDLPRLFRLMHESFDKPLRDSSVLDAVAHWHIEAGYQGAALLEPHPAGLYLSKFAVMTQARGEGLAGELWTDLKRHPSMFWRARPNNPINPWYLRQADGHHCSGDWTVFWRGVEPAHLPGLIEACLTRPPDFKVPR